MREQLIATVEPSVAPLCRLGSLSVSSVPPLRGPRGLPGPHPVDAVDRVLALVENTPGGHMVGSLLDLADSVACDVETARRALASLDPFDHVLSVKDIQRVGAEEPWNLTWAPVTGIVDLMLDWDLLILDISILELSEWLGVSLRLTARALHRLAFTPGATVVREGAGGATIVHISIALDCCPLTAEAPPAAGQGTPLRSGPQSG